MRLRMKTRSLMFIIILVAIALVTPGEVRNRRYRRKLARLREWHLRYAEIHQKERAVCEASIPMDPYDPEARKSYLSGYCFQMPGFNSWKTEGEWHTQASLENQKAAADYDREEKTARRRLILPVIFDIKRNAP
jgi:hypothetical protein